jgi:Arc/MetJ-type ribon-helix-helix transcriptional regulator
MTLAIQLPEELSEFVKEQIARLGYKDASAYFCALVEERQRRDLRAELEQSLLDADASPSTPMTRGDWDELRRRGVAEIERRRKRA